MVTQDDLALSCVYRRRMKVLTVGKPDDSASYPQASEGGSYISLSFKYFPDSG